MLAAKRQRERQLEELAKAVNATSHVKTLTTVQPFTFHSDRPKHESAREASERRAEELQREKQLLAAKRLRERHLEELAKTAAATGEAALSPPKTIVQPFTFHTDHRKSSSWQALKEASEKRAEALMREKQQSAAKRLKEKHLEDLKSVDVSTIKTKVEPFSFQTDQRHAKYQELLVESQRRQEEENERLTKFRARPCPESTFAREANNTTGTATAHSHRPATTPEPFNLKSTTRHEVYQQDLQKRIKEEGEKLEQEEARMRKSYKALPVPKSTYVSPPPHAHASSTITSKSASHNTIASVSFEWETVPENYREEGFQDATSNEVDDEDDDDDEDDEEPAPMMMIQTPALKSNYLHPPTPGGMMIGNSRDSHDHSTTSSSYQLGQQQPSQGSDPDGIKHEALSPRNHADKN